VGCAGETNAAAAGFRPLSDPGPPTPGRAGRAGTVRSAWLDRGNGLPKIEAAATNMRNLDPCYALWGA
jgi:hypothetical protein